VGDLVLKSGYYRTAHHFAPRTRECTNRFHESLIAFSDSGLPDAMKRETPMEVLHGQSRSPDSDPSIIRFLVSSGS
jgi:hypothetical protein